MPINQGRQPTPQQLEPDTHSFVVKIWLEEAPRAMQRPIWRGHITHVTSGQRRSVKSLCGIVTFVAIYLHKMGVRSVMIERLCRWFD